MTADFSHLQKMEVTKDTAEYELVELTDSPTLVGVFAGEGNRLYQNALLKHANRNARRIRSGKTTGRELKENRDQDRDLFPKCVLKGWSGVKDSAGKDVEWSEENCYAFLDALPNYLFDDVRNYFSNPSNFTEEGGISQEDMTELGNSSPPDFAGNSDGSATAGA